MHEVSTLNPSLEKGENKSWTNIVWFLLYRAVKKEFILHWNESVLVYELFLSDCCFFYLWRFSLALRERSFFISPYLCYPSYLLHLNANRTKMRTIFKGKHFKNGKIERVGGAALPQKFLSHCHFVEFVCRKRIFIFIYTFRISHVQNTKI